MSTVTISVNMPGYAGAIIGAGAYPVGAEVQLKADMAPNFYFFRWEENGRLFSADNPVVFEATRNYTLDVFYHAAGAGHAEAPFDMEEYLKRLAEFYEQGVAAGGIAAARDYGRIYGPITRNNHPANTTIA